jgi:hypothetical protein
MKLPHHSLIAVALTVLLPNSAIPEDSPRITEISTSGDQVTLRWAGGSEPFTIEQSTDLVNWNGLQQTDGTSATVPAGDAEATYLRVVAAPNEPELGDFYGQLRVDEGEFGDPLARHRLKSLWDFHLPIDRKTSQIPQDFFRELTLRLVYREGNGLATFIGKLEDLPQSEIKTTSKEMTVSWSFGEGEAKRDYALKLVFRYNIGTNRSAIHLSDPRYTLTCNYTAPQPKEGFVRDVGLVIKETKEDEVSLYQISEEKVPAWLQRDHDFEVGDVSVKTKYVLGLPMFEGSPAFIWKTPVLDKWDSGTTISGLTTEPLEIIDRFTQTYQPGHHNFWEVFWIEPALLPGISTESLEELRTADVRFIIATHPTAFPNQKPTLLVVGFDLVVRDL